MYARAHRQLHGHTTSSRVELPLHTLNHPQFVPQRNEIEFIQQRAAEKPRRLRRLKERHFLQSVIVTTILWLISDSNVRYYYSNGDTNMLLIFHGMQLIALILYYLLISSDPGYISTNNTKQQEQPTTSDDEVIVESDDQENATLITKKPRQRTVDLTACIIPPNFCERCKFFKPPRCKHCYLCDRCVIKYDHHCPLIDHCVGINNYNLFLSFVFCQGIVSFWTLCVVIDCLFISVTHNWIQWGLRVVLFVWMLYHSAVAGMMILFHTHAISTAQTTYEHTVSALKAKHERMLDNNPESRFCCYIVLGKIRNYVLCRTTYEYSNGCVMNWINCITRRGVKKEWSEPGYCVVIGDW